MGRKMFRESMQYIEDCCDYEYTFTAVEALLYFGRKAVAPLKDPRPAERRRDDPNKTSTS